jgi:hypothetical protein
MKMYQRLAIGFLVLIQPASANGGGYFRGGVEHAGDVAGFEPKETEKIRILDEKLTVALGSKSAAVEVRYLMHNETDKKVKVRFGFPVEESFDRELMVSEGEDGSKKTKLLKYCRNYVITASGSPVKSTWQVEKKPANDKRFAGIAGWLISEITFAAGEEKPVMIRFQSVYPTEEWNVSEETSENAGLFRYRLSTAACWAGTIGTGKIILKPNQIDPQELKVLKPVNRFKKEGDNWVWNFENLEPTLADDLEIEARPAINGHHATNTSRYVERGGKWLLAHTNYKVTASSVLPPADGQRYEASNVKEFWGDTTWSEGAPGTGTGEWLELRPDVSKPLAAIEIMPGYFKSEGLFFANARPKKIQVLLNDEHRFVADVLDIMESCRIPVIGYSKPVRKIRLTFQEVWPGTKFEDLCVTGVRLEVKLDKKPTIGPVR